MAPGTVVLPGSLCGLRETHSHTRTSRHHVLRIPSAIPGVDSPCSKTARPKQTCQISRYSCHHLRFSRSFGRSETRDGSHPPPSRTLRYESCSPTVFLRVASRIQEPCEGGLQTRRGNHRQM